MAVAWQATGTLAATTGADVTPVIPSHLANDALILVAWTRTTAITCATPSGWTLIATIDQGGFGVVYWFWKRATSAAETDPLCDWSSGTGDKFAIVHNIRGCTTVYKPFANFVAQSTNSDPSAMPAIVNAPYANSLVVFIASLVDDVATGMTITGDVAPTSLTTHSFTTTTTGSDGGQGIASATKATAGDILITSDFTGGVPGWFAAIALTFIPDSGGATVGPARWQASGTLLGSTGADITPVIPSHQANDLLVLHAMERALAGTLATPAGWTPFPAGAGGSNNRSGPGAKFWWFYRIAMSGAETNPLCDFTSAIQEHYAVVFVYRGVSGWDEAESYASTTPGTSLGIQATTQLPPLLVSAGISTDNTATAVSISTDSSPASLTQRSYTTITTGADAGCWASSEIITGAALLTDVNIAHTFTGAAAEIGLAYVTFTSFPSASVPIIVNMAPYMAHGLRR